MLILGICGSLRAASVNRNLLHACARLAPPPIEIKLFSGLGDLPLFNPDLEHQPPNAVETWRLAVAEADALLIASPEYAHGISGSMKNALDWLVSSESFAYKPVAVFNAAPRAHHAQQALKETLRTMSATLIEEACVSIFVPALHHGEQLLIDTPDVALSIKRALELLRQGFSLRAIPA